MRRIFWKSKLGVKVMIYTALAFLVGLGSFFAVRTSLSYIIEEFLKEHQYLADYSDEVAQRFQAYITEHDLASTDTKLLNAAIKKEKNVWIYIDNQLTEEEVYEAYLGDQMVVLQFKDGSYKVAIISRWPSRLWDYITYISLGTFFMVFMMILFILVEKRIAYLNQLEEEIKILEGGGMDYPITILGNDEIASLANGIEAMRLSFLERLEREQLLKGSNKILITAMAHDIRTPLTTQIGYLDMLETKKYHNDGQLKHYIHKSREKAYQIKALSDRLFAYFLDYNEEVMEDAVLETFSGNFVFEQLLEEHTFLLAEEGWQLDVQNVEVAYEIEVNIDWLRRVFDNIFSNIRKYAEPKSKIEVVFQFQQKVIQINFKNKINQDLKLVESSQLGINSIELLMQKMKGRLKVYHEVEDFELQLFLPVKPCKN